MVYIRGHQRDFDSWADDCGAEWSFAHLLPYFMRSECNANFTDPRFHGTTGPMRVAHVARPNSLNFRFLDAARELGYPIREDFNTGELCGFGFRQGTMRDGRRESMATAFLHPAAGRENLTIVTDCLTRRVTFKGTRAAGVDVEHAGERGLVRVRREVIVCAGAFESPALLMRSGVGHERELRGLGIETACHLPEVGHNLTDHIACAVAARTANTDSYALSWRTLPRAIGSVAHYLARRGGPLASNVFESHGFVTSHRELPAPDLQIIFMPALRNPSGFPIPLRHGYGINVALLTPRSRGRVRLATNDPRTAPIIDPQFLSDPADLAPMVAGLKLARRLLEARPFRPLAGVELAPGATVTDDAGLEAYVRNHCGTVYHPVSTCRMGNDGHAVVDASLRVRGIEGLRVVDASVFPRIIRGNTNAVVIMVAEKAADMIRNRAAPTPIALP